jgi:hypothetical protein
MLFCIGEGGEAVSDMEVGGGRSISASVITFVHCHCSKYSIKANVMLHINSILNCRYYLVFQKELDNGEKQKVIKRNLP